MITALWISPDYTPQLIQNDFNTLKYYLFEDIPTEESTFDGTTYYTYSSSLHSQLYSTNFLATYLKRLYTHSSSMCINIKGDILVYSYQDITQQSYASVPYYFVELITNYMHANSYVFT